MKLNLHTSHPSAFISSTFLDLKTEREYVAKILASRGLNVNALDAKPASNITSKREIVDGIKQSDFVILLIGDRYGSVLESMTGSPTQSITWWEYVIARTNGKPILAYFRNDSANNAANHDDPHDPRYRLKRQQLNRFRNIVTQHHNPAYFDNHLELAEKIDKALISVYRSGVITLTKNVTSFDLKIAELERELANLKAASSQNTSRSTNIERLAGLSSFRDPRGELENALLKGLRK